MRKKIPFVVLSLMILTYGVIRSPLFDALAQDPDPQPGAPGIGDDYFPEMGNGGYDVQHYTIASMLMSKIIRLLAQPPLR